MMVHWSLWAGRQGDAVSRGRPRSQLLILFLRGAATDVGVFRVLRELYSGARSLAVLLTHAKMTEQAFRVMFAAVGICLSVVCRPLLQSPAAFGPVLSSQPSWLPPCASVS